jgi:hypothetical protein
MATDEQMMQALQKRGAGKKPLLIGAGVLLVLVIVGAVLALRGGGKDASRHFSAMSRCLIGPPVAAGENVFFRLREAQLGAKHAPAEGANAWPSRCSGHATALYRSVDSTGQNALLKRLLAEQLGCGDDPAQPCKFPESGHPLGKADEIWKAAGIAGLELVDVPEVPMPEPRLKPEHAAGWPSLGDGSYWLASNRISDKGEVWLLFAPKDNAKQPFRLCRVSERGAKAKCFDSKKVPHLRGEIELVDALEPPAVAGTTDTDEGVEHAAFSLLDGTPIKLRSGIRKGYALDVRGKDVFLLEIANGTAEQTKLPFGSDTQAAQFGGWLGWFESDKADKEETRRLAVQKIGPGAKLEGEKSYLEGEIPPRIEPCAGALYGRSASPSKQTVWFAQGGGWSKPVSGPLPSAQRDEWASVCTKDRVTRFWVDKSAETAKLGMLDCRPKGCEKREVEWKGVKAKRWFAVTELGDRVAALYETFDDDKRLALAPFNELGSSLPIIITDSPEFSGEKFEDARVVIAPDFVVVVFSSEKSLHGLFVNQTARGPITASEN